MSFSQPNQAERRVFVTGHTGFKGAWLTEWLALLGHEVVGYALPPLPSSLAAIGVGSVDQSIMGDIRDATAVRDAILRTRPDIVMHLAAQPLVRVSYTRPRETFETNVMGTLALLEAVRECESVEATLIVTSDKVYRNLDPHAAFVEDDPLGGNDPYSASKAMSELLVQSWRSSFPTTRLASARAGNVIGGGDVSESRLLPDLIRAFSSGAQAVVRSPLSIRPWQHVLDCISGYLSLVTALLQDVPQAGGAWNFGPAPMDVRTVGEVADLTCTMWGPSASWVHMQDSGPPESASLALNSARARQELGWKSTLSLEESVAWTVHWHKRVLNGESPKSVTQQQILQFRERAGAQAS